MIPEALSALTLGLLGVARYLTQLRSVPLSLALCLALLPVAARLPDSLRPWRAKTA